MKTEGATIYLKGIKYQNKLLEQYNSDKNTCFCIVLAKIKLRRKSKVMAL